MSKILVIGQSHTEAVAAAAKAQNATDVVFFNFNSDRSSSAANQIATGSIPNLQSFEIVASMMGGNFYNSFGLIESSMRFDFQEPGEVSFDLGDRHLITYELMHMHFNNIMNKGYLRSIKALANRTQGIFMHICSPPPIESSEHISAHPGGFFSDKVHLGVTPASIRLKLHNLQTRVTRDFCERERMLFLDPPEDAVTSGGFLARPFWKQDPTHANADYGSLVLSQIRSRAGSQ